MKRLHYGIIFSNHADCVESTAREHFFFFLPHDIKTMALDLAKLMPRRICHGENGN